MHKNDQNFKNFSPAAPIGTAGVMYFYYNSSIMLKKIRTDVIFSKIVNFSENLQKMGNFQKFFDHPLPTYVGASKQKSFKNPVVA